MNGWPGPSNRGRCAAKRNSRVGTAWNGQLIVQNSGRRHGSFSHLLAPQGARRSVARWPGTSVQGQKGVARWPGQAWPDGQGLVFGQAGVVDWPGPNNRADGPRVARRPWPSNKGCHAAKRDSCVETAWNRQLIVQNPGRIRADEHGRMARAQKKGVAGWPGPSNRGGTRTGVARWPGPSIQGRTGVAGWPGGPMSRAVVLPNGQLIVQNQAVSRRTGMAGWPGPLSRGGRAWPDDQGPVSRRRVFCHCSSTTDNQGRTGAARWPGPVTGPTGHAGWQWPSSRAHGCG
jgi:hypothetical protein